ncbi:MAG: hypothetical protein WCA22_17325 [Candidatus Binatus sp.]
MVKRNVPQGTNLSETFDPRLDQDGIFEIDRSNLVLQLRSVRQAIIEGAEEMEMVAIERVFVKSVSQALTRTSRKLYVVGEELNGLLYLIERAQVPKADGRPAPKRKPPRRCRATD